MPRRSEHGEGRRACGVVKSAYNRKEVNYRENHMKIRQFWLALLLTLAAMPARGDSVDDAEAKKRGVPVAQVQAENALAKERQKTAALEKQIADLQKKIAEMSGAPPTAATAGGVPATRPATAPQGAASRASTLDFSGPRAASPLYDDLVKRYIAGDWSALAGDLAAKEKEIALLPAGNRADLAYIKQTVTECRPAWWDQIKNGKITQFKQAVWTGWANVSFKATAEPSSQMITVNGAPASQLGWPIIAMDAKEPITMMAFGIGSSEKCNFVLGDAYSSLIWKQLGGAEYMERLGAKVKTMTPVERDQFSRYMIFWQYATAAYYGTPPARRTVLIESATALAVPSLPALGARRPVAAALLIEIKTHMERYASLKLSDLNFFFNYKDATEEYHLGDYIINHNLLNASLTLEEDRHVREVIRQLVESNTDWKSSRIRLPNDLGMELDSDKDDATRLERLKFLYVEPKTPHTQF